MSRLRSFAVEAASPLVARSRWAKAGMPYPGGVGAIRVLNRPPLATREERH